MLGYIRNKIITVREIAGVDVHFLPDEKMLFLGAHMKLAGGKVVTVKNIDNFKSINELKHNIPGNVPLSVSINGTGVLMRKIASGDHDNVVASVLPGSNPNDFFHSIHRITSEHIAFIIRKTKVEEIINLFQKAGFRLVSLSLGTENIENILPFIDSGKFTLPTPSLTIDIFDQKIINIHSNNDGPDQLFKEIRIGETVFRKTECIGIGNALKLLHKPADRIAGDIRTTEINYLQKDYVYYKLFQFTKWTVLATTLALLLINFFLFNYYFKKNRLLVEQNNLTILQQEQKIGVGNRLDSSYSFFVKSGWNNNTRYGYFIDRIATLVPPSVSFRSLEVAPLQESLGVNDYFFSKNKIVISGVSNNPGELETFSRALRNIDGVETVALNSYSYKPDINAAAFTIEMTIKT